MESPPPVHELLQQLSSMIERIENMLSNSEIEWRWRPAEGEWSLVEVMCHLRDVEREVHQWRYHAITDKENAFLPGVSADEWAAERRYRDQDGQSAWLEFKEARAETVLLLKSLSVDMWRRTGRHAFLGQTSMHEILYISVRHDELHWNQIKEIIRGWELSEQGARGSASRRQMNKIDSDH